MAARKTIAKGLTAAELRGPFDAEAFDFKTTEELSAFEGWIGQDRAINAIKLSAQIPHSDFNLYVLGNHGSGRHTAVRSLLKGVADDRPAPSDWVYVNNFKEAHKPIAIELPPGRAQALKNAMALLIDDLANDIPLLFESDDYQSQRRLLDQDYSERNEAAFQAFAEKAEGRNATILRTPMGFAIAAKKEGEILTPEKFDALDKAEQERIEKDISELQEELAEVLKAVPRQQKRQRHAVKKLNARTAQDGVDVCMKEVFDAFKDIEEVSKHLKIVRADLIENAELFLADGQQSLARPFPVSGTEHYMKPEFRRYAVNVMVSKAGDAASGAPVVEEKLPTLAHLVGRIDHRSEMGTLYTDFTMIKPGALHRANGGFLILDAQRVLRAPLAWDALKQCLTTGVISIISASEMLSLITTTTLEPDPIPLKVRIALVGERFLHFLLVALDPDYAKLFKVHADFNDKVPGTPENFTLYAGLIGTIARNDNLRGLTPEGVARILQEAARLAEDAERLSLNIGQMRDIMREADYWAGGAGRKLIDAEDVEHAIDAADERADRIPELTKEGITRETVLIDTDGAKVGQVNALSVLQVGLHRFGRPSRITGRVRMGSGQVVDIEREVELGGPLHSKGVMILSSYLASHYALDVPMSLWASLVFEQSYGGIDGDSASAAEIFVLLSALSGLPIQQNLAVTGSVNQIGEIQAIGGVNEKIEGFFDICDARGLTGDQGVLIPGANIKHLVLRPRVIEAVKAGKFRIIPIKTVNEGITILTGHDAGERGLKGAFPKSSLNGRVEQTLLQYASRRKAFGANKKKNNDSRDGKM